MKPGRDPLTLAELQRRFSDEAKCLAFLERARWPNGPVCPRCGSVDHASRVTTRPGDFTCLDCMRRFSVTAGTPMDHTHLPICTWIIAACLLTTSSKGISSLKLASLLGLQYRTTWHLAHRIRAMMAEAPDLLRGLVELDETDIGGKTRRSNKPQPKAPIPRFEPPEPPKPEKKPKRRKRGRGGGKTMAFTAVERGGKARMSVLATHGTDKIAQLVFDWVERSAVISTDELPAYLRIGRMQAGHIRVNHSAEEFARNDERPGLRAHVNTAESLHALLKRAIMGVWHWISDKHLGRYLTETTFHWNTRGPFEDRLAAVFGSTRHGPLPLKALLP